ncbi:MAG TPA: ATP-binding protein [Noviherbaspirillum sp.]
MTRPSALDPALLRRCCDPAQFSFQTTAELPDLTEMIGQARAMDAVRFGAGIRHDGYNIFVLGPAGMGKRSMVRQFLEKKAQDGQAPSDWCYVNNFAQPHMPHALKLPHGRGAALRLHMEQRIAFLRTAIPALFESDEYRAKSAAIQEEFSNRQAEAFTELGSSAEKQNVVLLRTPGGFGFAPARNGEVMPAEEYEKLADEEKKRIVDAIAVLQARLEEVLNRMPQWWKERSERLKQLDQETVQSAVGHAMNELRALYADLPAVLSYLDEVQKDVVENVDEFRKQEDAPANTGMMSGARDGLQRYKVNVLVTNGVKPGAPIISEDNPTYSNLVGRVEHVSQLGALVTDFTLIKPGALHRANGGYLLLDVYKVLSQPFAWEGLKRTLKSRAIHIESLGQIYSLVSTVSLEPEAIPLDAKIVLFGDRFLYYLLQQYDPEFGELFKVAADFEEHVEHNAENNLLYARLIATLARKEDLLPFDRTAVARVIEHGARLAGDAERLSTHMRSVADLLRESDYWAREAGRQVVQADDVQHSIDTQIRRQDRLRDRLHEAILRDTLMIATHGAARGQINALSVLELGGFAFGQPTRITANTRLGDGQFINIEREVRLSGAIHSKGVLIMSSFLATRYARNQPLSLSASLVFEQSYGMIDGDSASMAELCALLSDLADMPIRQSLAITGSVNQFGHAQAIGGVNEKIEGFFDICTSRGLTGEQGVLIPAANVPHLVLRHDIAQAAEQGRFHVYAIDNVDQAISLLTGADAGEPDEDGVYPRGSVNQRVAARLAALTDLRVSFARREGKELNGRNGVRRLRKLQRNARS